MKTEKLVVAFNKDLTIQSNSLIQIVNESPILNKIFKRASLLDMKDYYIGAGCIAQTVWNYYSDYPLDYGIDDIDFAYFNDSDVSFEDENKVVESIKGIYSDIPIKIDVKNQARVHIWYEQRFGFPIRPYKTLEDAINTWPTTATTIGIRKEKDEWKIYAPYGLNDLFGKIVRANKLQITKEIFEKKVQRWSAYWTDLKIIPWNQTSKR